MKAIRTPHGKYCTKCGEWHAYGDYHRDHSRHPDGLKSHCQPCRVEAKRKKRMVA